MNEQLDPGLHRFRIVQRFEVLPKPGIANPSRLEELTAVPDANGRYALIEFTGALPRAKLYSNWLVNTNDQANLKKLADLSFDPARTVLVSTPEPGLPAAGTNDASGTVEYRSYRPKHIVLATQSPTTDVLLLNDQFDPNWSVTVDGHPAPLLRCNFLMRGVMVPAGSHEVRFDFSVPYKLLYVTLAAIGLASYFAPFCIFEPSQRATVNLTEWCFRCGLKARKMIAQCNALGKTASRISSPERTAQNPCVCPVVSSPFCFGPFVLACDSSVVRQEFQSMYQAVNACRICDSRELESILHLGNQCFTGIFPKDSNEPLASAPLEIVKCERCGLVQLHHNFEASMLYGPPTAIVPD